MKRANEDIRKQARASNVPLWAVAEQMGISEPTMTRKLRVEMSAGEKAGILCIISELSEGREGKQYANEND